MIMTGTVCAHCNNPIESKNDLIVMRRWLLFPKALHKKCWGEQFSTHGGAGSVGYGTGVFAGRQRGLNLRYIPVNSTFFTIIAVIALIIGFFIFTVDMSTATFTANGVDRAPTGAETVMIKSVIGVLFALPAIQRIWSYSSIEKKFS